MLTFFQGIVGNVTAPEYLNAGYGSDVTGGGLINFVSNLVKFIILIGGIWAFINLLIAGFYYIIYADKPEELIKVHQKIYMSGIGLVIMVGSFVIAGVISLILFNDASYIFNPQVYGPN